MILKNALLNVGQKSNKCSAAKWFQLLRYSQNNFQHCVIPHSKLVHLPKVISQTYKSNYYSWKVFLRHIRVTSIQAGMAPRPMDGAEPRITTWLLTQSHSIKYQSGIQERLSAHIKVQKQSCPCCSQIQYIQCSFYLIIYLANSSEYFFVYEFGDGFSTKWPLPRQAQMVFSCGQMQQAFYLFLLQLALAFLTCLCLGDEGRVWGILYIN